MTSPIPSPDETATLTHEQRVPARRLRPALWGVLGAGLITGAAGNDPSGIATYLQAGAKFRFGLAWILLLTYPLLVAVQTISAGLGRTTGRGIAGNLRVRCPAWLVHALVGLLLLANVLNIGADLQGMAEAVRLLLPHTPAWGWILALGVLCSLGQLLLVHVRYISFLKWLALIPLSYLLVLLVIHVPWGEVAQGLFRPQWPLESSFWLMATAVLGTTVSPYLFFWQAAQEVEDAKADPARTPLLQDPTQSPSAFGRIRIDTIVGMGVSNLVGLAVLVTAGATLPQSGIHEISTAAEAAQSLRPVAGNFAFVLFALGLIGSGVLCVQVLAGSAAYALAEALRWPVGLARGSSTARIVYLIVLVATLIGVLATSASVSAIHALVWAGVINAVVAVPALATVMWMASDSRVTGALRPNRGWLFLGWLAAALMTLGVTGWVWSAL